MSKVLINIKTKPNKKDLLIYDGIDGYKNISKEELIPELKEIEKIKEEIAILKETLNEKFKEIHDVLQILTNNKGE